LSDGTDGGLPELLQWLITILTAVGLVIQHVWSRRSLVTHRNQDQFDKYIADPARTLISKIDSFAATVPQIETGVEPNVALKTSHAILVRSVNSFAKDCVDSPVGGGDDWFQISTKEIERGIPAESGLETSALQIKSLVADLERLKSKIQEKIREKRPPD
jgi:hypothetical protein